MSKAIQIFENEQFGQIRTLTKEGEPWFVGRDVARALGYSDTADALKKHVDEEDKQILKPGETPTLKLSNYGAYIINESGLYSLIMSSRLPSAKQFKHWVTAEVLPSIRKTGGYTMDKAKQNRLDIMERNSRAREASLWLRIADKVKSDTYQQICASYASKSLAGHEVIPLPAAPQQYYTATDIGAMLGVSARRIGIIANENKMKVKEYGCWFHDKSPYSAKEVEVFRYNDAALDYFRHILDN